MRGGEGRGGREGIIQKDRTDGSIDGWTDGQTHKM